VTYTALGEVMTSMSQGSVGVAYRAPVTTHRSSLELAVALSAVARARHWTANVLSPAGSAKAAIPREQELIDNIVLLVSELVTNAIQAAGSTGSGGSRARVWLAIERSAERVRIEVHDSASVPIPRQSRTGCPADDDEESGRGLAVIAALASDWGWHPDAVGKVVWCELAAQ
jgi:anti-sigma regulatory factor (Ser/Thr protein kinase)